MTAIRQHGVWRRYVPQPFPEGVPANALFCRRENDGADWYAFLKSGTLEADTVKMTVRTFPPEPPRIQAVQRDATMIFPDDALLLEVEGLSGEIDQLSESYGQRAFDAKTATFGAQPIPPSPVARTIADSAQSLLFDNVRSLAAQGRTDEALAALVSIVENQP